MKVAIVGAGASGLICASYLSNNSNLNITIFEKNKKVGSKILASGNGKCNISNKIFNSFSYNNTDFVNRIFQNISPENMLLYFESLGLVLKTETDGRVYPFSYSSKTVLDILLNSLKNVKIKLECPVTKISKKNKKYIVNDETFDYLVLASGSTASIIKRKQKDVYEYFENFDLKFNEVKPSLVGFVVKDDIKKLSGLRIKCHCRLYSSETEFYEEYGEVIFKDNGISGIVIMNLSSIYNRLTEKQKSNSFIRLRLIEGYDGDLKKRIEDKKLNGLLHPKLIDFFKFKNKETIFDDLINMDLKIKGLYDVDSAQVCHGGIDVSEVASDFRLMKYPRAFACGEILDIDGVCGGYNLTFAFISGLTAAKEIVDEIS